MKRILILGMLLSVLTFAFTYPFSKTIHGIVKDSGGTPLAGVTVQVKGTKISTVTDLKGKFSITAPDEKVILIFIYAGYDSKEVKLKSNEDIAVVLKSSGHRAQDVALAKSPVVGIVMHNIAAPLEKRSYGYNNFTAPKIVQDQEIRTDFDKEYKDDSWRYNNNFNTEGYDKITENPFLKVNDNPLSTFSIDVDAASYSNMRRYIKDGQLPPPGAIRVEELINYFSYHYPQPRNDDPFSVNMELSSCPWNGKHQLVLIGLQGKKIIVDNLPPSNLVFLIDVSGSMDEPDKLPLVQSSLKLLVDQLRPQDKVALVVYAGNAGLVLPSTNGDEKIKIKSAIDELQAGGSTAGGSGIQLAYKIAKENFVNNGNNRIILCTDGDFNVGISSDDALENLIEEERKSGVYLTVLGFGTGNYQDAKMQKLADKGNGNHSYIDGISEAKKVLINEFGGTLFTIAKDVKLQVEFNPGKVKAYRLIGYENRMLAKEDFNNDKKDAGELGSGHTVTALYEIIPIGINDESLDSVDVLRYQKTNKVKLENVYTDELLNVKLRYKRPDNSAYRNNLYFLQPVDLITDNGNSDTSKLIQFPLIDEPLVFSRTSNNFRFAAAVAEFGMLLRNSQYKGNGDFNLVEELATNAMGNDAEGYRKEFLQLVKTAAQLKEKKDVATLEVLPATSH